MAKHLPNLKGSILSTVQSKKEIREKIKKSYQPLIDPSEITDGLLSIIGSFPRGFRQAQPAWRGGEAHSLMAPVEIKDGRSSLKHRSDIFPTRVSTSSTSVEEHAQLVWEESTPSFLDGMLKR